jgi:ABC-type microcin C transport system permease subunit YejB
MLLCRPFSYVSKLCSCLKQQDKVNDYLWWRSVSIAALVVSAVGTFGILLAWGVQVRCVLK